jgi:phosphatidylglycerophosphatase A
VSYRLAYLLAVWFGCGLVPKAPGTMGTLGAIPLFLVLARGGPLAVAGAAVVIALIGVWAASQVVERTGLPDPQIVCIDEVAGVLITLAAAPHHFRGILAAVVLFRIFDQWKPWPARWAEQLPAGWGVVMDDVFAGLWGAGILVLARVVGFR